MDKTRKPDKMRLQPEQCSLLAWVCVALLFLPLAVGCQAPQTHTGDPLLNEYYPKAPTGQPLPPPTKTTSAVPPYPSNNSAASTAAIAANTALPGGRNLAINDKTGTNWMLTNTSNSGAGNPPIVQPIPRDATFSGPITQSSALSTPGTVITTGSWTSATPAPPAAGPLPPLGTVTPEILQATLQGKGALGLKQENVADGLRVSCYVPQRSNPGNFRYLETTARDYSTALQALLQQVDGQP
jgi:hypothetical protein